MARSPDRRALIAETTLDLIARDGLRALTHRAVDRALDLPDGSCSYYFRTRSGLIDAAVRRLTERSRAEFAHSGLTRPPAPIDVDAAARAVATVLDHNLSHRRRDLLVRYALATDPTIAAEQRAALATSLFSREAARGLALACEAEDADGAAADLVSLAEGLTADRLPAPGRWTVSPPARRRASRYWPGRSRCSSGACAPSGTSAPAEARARNRLRQARTGGGRTGIAEAVHWHTQVPIPANDSLSAAIPARTAGRSLSRRRRA